MDVDHVDMLAVQLAEDLRPDDLIGGPAGGPAGRQVDDRGPSPAAAGSSRARRAARRSAASRGDTGSSADDFLLAADVQVRQRLVQQQQPGPADQRVRDQDPLLLAAGQVADPLVAELLRRRRRGASRRSGACARAMAAGCRAGARPAPARPDPGRAAAYRGPAGLSAARSRSPGRAGRGPRPSMRTVPADGCCSPRMTRSSVVLPAPFDPISPTNSPARMAKRTSLQHVPAAQPHADAVHGEHVRAAPGELAAVVTSWPVVACWPVVELLARRRSFSVETRHSFSVEVLLATARCSAWTSASIHDW